MKSLLVSLLLLIPVASFAQESPKSELFVGYSLLRTDSDTLDLNRFGVPGVARREGANLNGFNVSGGYNPTNWLGFIADVGGNYGHIDYSFASPGLNLTAGVRTNFHTLLFGPQISVRGQGTTFFARALAGVGFVNQRLDLTAFGGQRGEGSDTAFAAAFGGGLDLHLSERISFRVIQADYLLTRFGDSKFQVNGLTLSGPDTQHNLRFSTGFVFRNRD